MPKPGRSGANTGRRLPSARISGFSVRLEVNPCTRTMGVESSSGTGPKPLAPLEDSERSLSSLGTRTYTRLLPA